MNQKAIRVLEFHKITQQLSALAVNESAKTLCEQLVPSNDYDAISHALSETDEALLFLTQKGSHPITAFPNVNEYLSRAQKGAVLSPRALLDIAQVLYAARYAKTGLSTQNEAFALLEGYANMLQSNRSLENDIKEAILSEDQIADSASPALQQIRRQLRILQDRVKDKLNQLVHQPNYAKYLQEPIVTVRNGRYVVPVRQEYRQNIPGLVHDQSSTGATLFIEPIALVEIGNELKQWEAKEAQEIEKILALFTEAVLACLPSILSNIQTLTHLDFVFAKARLSLDMRAIRPKINRRRYINLVNVRHPLLPRDTVVPLTLHLGDAFTTLIVTGPNTGGKTVALKTIGLLSLMAQAGLHVPGEEGTELAVFDDIFADIGDEQSIEQSLSTFSSHMTNIVGILDEVTPQCLVLFDELGAGTDPTEGAALAQAILMHLNERKVRTMATTHYSELKAYALTAPTVENASAEFDIASLRPTYRLTLGIPGKSNAFEISKRLGLKDSFIQKAQTLLSKESVQFEDVLANAEQHLLQAKKEQEATRAALKDAENIRAQTERLKKEIERKYLASESKAKEEAKRIIDKAKRETGALLEELKTAKQQGIIDAGKASDIKRRMRELQSGMGGSQFDELDDDIMVLKTAAVGDAVILKRLGTQATVLTVPDSKGDLTVQAGAMKMKVNLSALMPGEKKQALKKTTVHAKTQSDKKVGLSCDVRGMALDEALLEVDNYLSSAALSGFQEISIVHGKGTGILRAGIHSHLKHHALIKSYRLGIYGEGETGVTIVTLK